MILTIDSVQKSDTEKDYILEARNDEGAYEYRIILSTATEPAGKNLGNAQNSIIVKNNHLISLCTKVACKSQRTFICVKMENGNIKDEERQKCQALIV